MPGRKNSEARIRANNKYNAKAYDRINLAVPKGRKEEIKAYADITGQSINGYIVQAIDERIERDSGEPPASVTPEAAETPQEAETIRGYVDNTKEDA